MFHISNLILAGKIKLFAENRDAPLISAQYDNILPIKYFGFSSYGNSLARYWFNCEDEENYDEDGVKESCQYADAKGIEYKETYGITDISGAQSESYIVNFPFYVQADGDARVLFKAEPTSRREANTYEIGELTFSLSRLLWIFEFSWLKSKSKTNNNFQLWFCHCIFSACRAGCDAYNSPKRGKQYFARS